MLLFNFLQYVIFADVISSWVMRGKENGFTAILHIFTEPLFFPGRKIQQKFFPQLPVDLSPILALFALQLLSSFVRMIFV